MEQKLKERLLGTTVLVIVVVIFVPMLLNNKTDTAKIDVATEATNESPTDEFKSRIVPIIEAEKAPVPPEPIPEPQVSTVNKTEEQLFITVPPLPQAPEDQANPNILVKDEPTMPVKPLDPVPSPQIKQIEPENQTESADWVVQMGSFSSQENARKLHKQLQQAGYSAVVAPREKNGSTAYRVRITPVLSRAEADRLLKKIQDQTQLKGIVVPHP